MSLAADIRQTNFGPDRSVRRHPASGREGWLFVIAPAVMLAVLLLRPSTNSDMFWQLKLGELTLANRGPIWTEPFAVTHLGEPLQNLAWAGQALFALVRDWTGWRGLRLFDALCWAGGFWVGAIACLRRGDTPLAVAAGLGLAFIATLPTAILRPQSLASVCFGLLLVLLVWRAGPRTRIALGALLLVIWQNLHPSVSVGLGVIGIHAATGWWQWWRDRSVPMLMAETVLVPVSALAMFCTPDGVSILQTSARNGEISLLVGVGEWMALWEPINRTVALPIMAVAFVGLALVRRNPGRIDLREGLTCLALLAMTVLVYRFVLFFGIALVPVIARCIAPRRGEGGAHVDVRRLIAMAAAGLVVVATVVTASRPVTFRKHIPLAALETLKRENLSGTVFSDFTLGGVVIHAGYPAWRVAFDGRYYRYSRAEWERFAAIQSATENLAAVEARYRPVAWVLEPTRNAALVRQLDAHRSRWRAIVRDANVVIFAPVR